MQRMHLKVGLEVEWKRDEMVRKVAIRFRVNESRRIGKKEMGKTHLATVLDSFSHVS